MQIQYSLLYPSPDIAKTYDVRFEKAEFEGYVVSAAETFPLTMTYHRNRILEISGEGRIDLIMSCDRCLSDVKVSVSYVINDELHLDGHTDAEGWEVCCLKDDDLLDTDLLMEPFISTNIPMKVLCRKDCKGICARCGADLNLGPCSCQLAEAPTKMAEALMKALQKTNLD